MNALKLTKEQQAEAIRTIQSYFEEERGEELGALAASGVLDLFMTQLAPYIYNQALSDARTTVNQRMASMEEDLFALERKLPRPPR
ncbi:DUF2164 domain-containing protein [Paenibacillus barcinonensis]|uniref:DUF2164 domain-containing protein n=1 Tax=Paenibacillus barcinonensis TaxID=198119 RepID=A0A2V4W6W2_PAEBA|nr:DUF2164 domain-containing protein [Paenibacillus barcinonensis]PYE50748.1 uncharacterized protein (DUF2164 family) [Paenibacillus barcinonensis]QKS57428.1 DUF2164 domain-containing protein [Paenibacillus barcinonensis]